MIDYMNKFLTRKCAVFAVLGALSAAALGMAFIAQYQYGLEPCVLCIYQRIPFAIIIGLCLIGALAVLRGKSRTAGTLMALTGLTFLTNSVIAFYHTGVERKWWASFLEGCHIPEIKGNITDVLAQIESTPPARCDEIPWTDPLIGLSMANYNVLFCGAFALVALYSLTRRA